MKNNKFIQEKNIDGLGLFLFLLPVHRTVRTHGRYATVKNYSIKIKSEYIFLLSEPSSIGI